MKEKSGVTGGKIAVYTVLILLSILTIIPFAWMLSASLKLNKDVVTWPMEWIPSNPQGANYNLSLIHI